MTVPAYNVTHIQQRYTYTKGRVSTFNVWDIDQISKNIDENHRNTHTTVEFPHDFDAHYHMKGLGKKGDFGHICIFFDIETEGSTWS